MHSSSNDARNVRFRSLVLSRNIRLTDRLPHDNTQAPLSLKCQADHSLVKKRMVLSYSIEYNHTSLNGTEHKHASFNTIPNAKQLDLAHTKAHSRSRIQSRKKCHSKTLTHTKRLFKKSEPRRLFQRVVQMNVEGEEAGYDFQSYIADLSRVGKDNANYVSVRRFTPKPDEFVRMPRPRSNRKIHVSLDKANEEFKPQHVIEVFTNPDPSELENFCLMWCTNVENEAINEFLATDGALDIVNSAVSAINSATLMTAFCQFVRTLIEMNDTEVVDSGILMNLEGHLDKFPIETLFFFLQMPLVSIYARNAMVCEGVLGDVIALALKTSDPEVRIACSQVLHSAFACEERIAYEDVDLNDILKMLVLTEAEALYFVILSLVEIVSGELSAVSDLYAHDVHTFLAKNIGKEHLTGPCLCLAGNMATCEASEMTKLIESGVVREMIKQLQSSDEEDQCYVLWGIANGVQSSPEQMIPLLQETKFVDQSMALLEKGSQAVRKDTVLFIATVFLFCPVEYIAGLVSKPAVDVLASTLDCGKTTIVVRCLDAIARVLFLGYTNEKMKYTIDVVLSCEILTPKVEELTKTCTKAIALNKARTLLAEIRKKEEERKQK